VPFPFPFHKDLFTLLAEVQIGIYFQFYPAVTQRGLSDDGDNVDPVPDTGDYEGGRYEIRIGRARPDAGEKRRTQEPCIGCAHNMSNFRVGMHSGFSHNRTRLIQVSLTSSKGIRRYPAHNGAMGAYGSFVIGHE